MQLNPICANCRNFSAQGATQLKGPSQGQCRAKPPTVMVLPVPPSVAAPQGGMAVQMVFPAVSGDLWCGEHKPILTPT